MTPFFKILTLQEYQPSPAASGFLQVVPTRDQNAESANMMPDVHVKIEKFIIMETIWLSRFLLDMNYTSPETKAEVNPVSVRG